MLDVNTTKGQATLAEEDTCARLFERHHAGVQYVRTPKDSPCRVDAILITPERMLAAVEQKSRFDVTLEEFRTAYRNTWLVTHEKLVAARAYAAEYHVPLYGFLWIVKDKTLLIQRITDRAGAWVARFDVRKTKTQATVNGGTAVRDNAYVDMTGCRTIADAPAVVDTAWLAEYDRAGSAQWGAAW